MDPHSSQFCARCGNPAPAWYRGDNAKDASTACSCGARVARPDDTQPEEIEPATGEPPDERRRRWSHKRVA